MILIKYPHRIESPRSKKMGHWRKMQRQKKLDNAALDEYEHVMSLVSFKPRAVEFTRVAPRPLDSDNLAFSFKATQDRLVTLLGLPDDSPRVGVEWVYKNKKGAPKEYGVEIRIYE